MNHAKTAPAQMRPVGLVAGAPRLALILLFAVIAIAPAIYPHPYLITIMTQTAIFAMAAMSLDVLLGYTGMASFGQAAFFGLGAYSAALVGVHYSASLPLTLGAAAAISGIAALFGGWLAIRAAGIYFIFLTLALSQLVHAVLFKWQAVTGGDDGLTGVPRPSLGWLDRVIDLSNDRSFYVFTLFCSLLVFLLLRRTLSSCFGSVLTGIRDNPERMRAIGYNIRAYKIAAFLLSGVLTGLAGGLFAHQFQLVTPEQAHWQTSALLMVMVILGGSGSLIGPAIGALIIVLLQNVVSSYTDRWATIMALMFIAVVMFARGGVWGLIRKPSEGSHP